MNWKDYSNFIIYCNLKILLADNSRLNITLLHYNLHCIQTIFWQ